MGNLMKESDSLKIAAQNNAISKYVIFQSKNRQDATKWQM